MRNRRHVPRRERLGSSERQADQVEANVAGMAQRVGVGGRIGVDEQMKITLDVVRQANVYRFRIRIARFQDAAVAVSDQFRVNVERSIVREEDAVGPRENASIAGTMLVTV